MHTWRIPSLSMHFINCLRHLETGKTVCAVIRKPVHQYQEGDIIQGWFPEGKRFLQVVNRPEVQGEVVTVHLKLLPPERISPSLVDRAA